jgi:hypothetical protein
VYSYNPEEAAMSVFRRKQLAGLQTEVARLRALSEDLTQRLTRMETRPLPRPSPLTPEAFGRLEELATDASRSATIARADVAVRVSNLDAVVTDLSTRLSADHDALRAKVDDLSKTLEYQSEYLETHADQLAISLQTDSSSEAAVPADLRANQTRIAKDLARLTIELRDEVSKLASLVRPGATARAYAYTFNGNAANGHNGDHAANGSEATADADEEVIDLRS